MVLLRHSATQGGPLQLASFWSAMHLLVGGLSNSARTYMILHLVVILTLLLVSPVTSMLSRLCRHMVVFLAGPRWMTRHSPHIVEFGAAATPGADFFDDRMDIVMVAARGRVMVSEPAALARHATLGLCTSTRSSTREAIWRRESIGALWQCPTNP